MRTWIPALFLIFCISSCFTDVNKPPGEAMAYVPVYAQPSELAQVSVEPAKATEKAGKIYAYGTYIFQNDINKGVHVIDNSVAGNPRKVAFIKIPYSTELAVKGHYLYTNCVSDLLVLDLQNPQQPVLVKRVTGAFPLIEQEYPPFTHVSFVCADPSKGVVVDWELKTVKSPACRR